MTRRALGALVLVALAVDLGVLAGIGLAFTVERKALLDVREALFSRVDEAALFALPPEDLVEDGFQTDAPARVREWSERITDDVPWMRELAGRLSGATSLDKVRALVGAFSSGGGEEGGCGAYRDLMHQFERLPTGEGCCSDHVQVFLAGSAILGVFAREVQHVQHTAAEFWSPETGRWIWVDPHLALLARGPDGAHLSLRELRERWLRDEPVTLEFIGSAGHRYAGRDPRDTVLYDAPEDLATISMTFGNAVFAEERFRQDLSVLPRAPRQLLGLSTGRLPWKHFTPEGQDEKVAHLLGVRRTLLLVLPMLAAVNVAGLLAGVAWWRRPAGAA